MIELATGIIVLVFFFMNKQRLGFMMDNTLDMGVNVTEVGKSNTDLWAVEQRAELQSRIEELKSPPKSSVDL